MERSVSGRERGLKISKRFAENGFTPLGRSTENGFTLLERSTENGFTLIEMMVALAIFSLAALALIRLEGATLSSTGTLADRAIGQIVARNLAVQLLTDPLPPAFGAANGTVVNAGRTWHWTREVKRTEDVRIVRIDLAVTDDAGRPGGALSLARPAT
jgi:general secretion pathway protein I